MTNVFGLSYAAGGFSDRWGHYAPQLLTASILASIYLGFRGSPPGPVTLIATAGLLGFVLLTWLYMRAHDRRLCEACARAMPLNPAERAARCRTRFATAHAGSNVKLVACYLLVLLASNALLLVPYGRWGWAAVQASMIYLILAYSTHRTLQPWCPWCSDGGGGSEVDDPAPDLPRGPSRELV